jgi:hypothetical protein
VYEEYLIPAFLEVLPGQKPGIFKDPLPRIAPVTVFGRDLLVELIIGPVVHKTRNHVADIRVCIEELVEGVDVCLGDLLPTSG